jgi:hypothetical protein
MQLRDKLWAALLAAILAVGYCIPVAKADGLPKSGLLPLGEVAKAGSWTGISVGGYGAWNNVDADLSPFPITFGSTGPSAGVTIAGSIQAGKFVGEIFADYGWVFGDLNDLGINNEMALGGRAGVLWGQAFVYALGAKAWADTDGGTFEGWQYGGGVQVRLPNTPTFVSLEYRRTDWDVSGPIDVSSDSVRAILTYRFGSK